MSTFHWPRLTRLVLNDLLTHWKKIWIATLALAGVGLVAYLINVDPRAVVRPALYLTLFPIVLIGGGLAFTSTIFADLHHPLQRFQFLTLPCSNLERFLGRYLLSGPLFYLYVLIVYAAFDGLAAILSHALRDTSAAAFAPFGPEMRRLSLAYFGMHALMFGGAIFFRSHVALKTLLAVVATWFGVFAVGLVAVRLFYWNYFESLFRPVRGGIPMQSLDLPPHALTAAGVALSLWLLFIGYQCLREHEVQG